MKGEKLMQEEQSTTLLLLARIFSTKKRTPLASAEIVLIDLAK